jgi:hypothetical protein
MTIEVAAHIGGYARGYQELLAWQAQEIPGYSLIGVALKAVFLCSVGLVRVSAHAAVSALA